MKRILAAVLAALVGTGCASITRGAAEVFVIETSPPNAQATLSNGLACTTPCSLHVPRRGDFDVTVERAGYETFRATVASNVDGGGIAGMAGNLIFGGIVGAGIDAGSGAMHSHRPNPLVVTLVPLESGPGDAVGTDPNPEAASASEEGAGAAVEDPVGGESSE